jgi:hypothetical protein
VTKTGYNTSFNPATRFIAINNTSSTFEFMIRENDETIDCVPVNDPSILTYDPTTRRLHLQEFTDVDMSKAIYIPVCFWIDQYHYESIIDIRQDIELEQDNYVVGIKGEAHPDWSVTVQQGYRFLQFNPHFEVVLGDIFESAVELPFYTAYALILERPNSTFYYKSLPILGADASAGGDPHIEMFNTKELFLFPSDNNIYTAYDNRDWMDRIVINAEMWILSAKDIWLRRKVTAAPSV